MPMFQGTTMMFSGGSYVENNGTFNQNISGDGQGIMHGPNVNNTTAQPAAAPVNDPSLVPATASSTSSTNDTTKTDTDSSPTTA